ncbi:DNA-binding MarR family transcriptional regulator [Rhodopseudomonas rhenobacensis]|uniref:DNA-binding MarR family transcriptional regulator n=1 Tax=Rhodopseudomonas rhenobacensis TaxID=87461 RepID=A0A7W7Z0X9_9BRAD|nr:MarR family transcriptional regulator [Rhodopseudomonas rhenobacensis]MBB5045999.1 DNA-binding MarR family transcriptional regulator [Rhodopseudomonas rhenobacensis]
MSLQNDPPTAPDALTLAHELRLVIGRLKRRLREQAYLGDLTWSQVAVLGHIDREGPATVTALARAEGMRPQSMGATVAALEAAGLVSGAPDPKDGRQTLLSLTPACRDLIVAGRAAREDWLQRAIQSNLTAEETVQLSAAVVLLRRLAAP